MTIFSISVRQPDKHASYKFVRGFRPPIGYRIIEAAEQRGHRLKNTFGIDPIQAETARLILSLPREGNGFRPRRDWFTQSVFDGL